jgi:hypothetical protein
LQALTPEFKTHSHQKRKKIVKKGNEVDLHRQNIPEGNIVHENSCQHISQNDYRNCYYLYSLSSFKDNIPFIIDTVCTIILITGSYSEENLSTQTPRKRIHKAKDWP